MTNIKIDKNIPIPPSKLGEGGGKYPWSEMEVGDSFLWPSEKQQKQASALAVATGRRLNKRFATRKTPEGVRVWRVD